MAQVDYAFWPPVSPGLCLEPRLILDSHSVTTKVRYLSRLSRYEINHRETAPNVPIASNIERTVVK